MLGREQLGEDFGDGLGLVVEVFLVVWAGLAVELELVVWAGLGVELELVVEPGLRLD